MDDIDKIKKYWEILKKQEGYSNDKDKTMKAFVYLLEIFKTASQYPKGPELQIIMNFVYSSLFTYLNIEETIYNKSNLSIDKLVEYSEQELDHIKILNKKYVQIIDDFIQITRNYKDIEDQVLRAIKQLQESKLNIEDKSQIILKYEWVEYAILKFNPDRYPNYRFLTTSEVPYLNTLLQFKLHITDELFPFIIAIYKKTNTLGSENQFILVNHIIDIYKKSLIPDKQLQPFGNLIMGSKGIKLCKATSDKFAEQMIKLLTEKQKAEESSLLKEKLKFQFQNEYKKLCSHYFTSQLVNKNCIPEDLNKEFISLLENDGLVDYKPINWTTSDWKLFLIISKFEEEELLSKNKYTSIIEYIINNFTYKGERFNNDHLSRNISRAKAKLKYDNKYGDFATDLNNIFNSFS